jgi:hypothetical protein
MSDTLALSNSILTGSEVPRYYDLINGQKEPEEKPEEIISRFDKLRRR